MSTTIIRQTLDIPIREVTLLEDRARIVRRDSADLPAGIVRVRIDGVAAVLSDKTLTGNIAEPSGARVADVRIVREYVVRHDPDAGDREAQTAALDEQLRKLDSDIESLETERVITERHASGFDKLTIATMSEISEDVSWGKPVQAKWREQLEQLGSSERAMRDRLVEIASDIEELRRKRQLLDERIVKTQNPIERETAAIEADIAVDTAGSYTVTFEYVVPNACWRPYHTAKLVSAPDADEASETDRVAFTTDACVWQNTGEDWTDVELVLSTERASLGTEPPPLSSDVLAVRKKSDTVFVETREKQIQTLGPDMDPDQTQPQVAVDLPGIDDGGVALNLRAPRPSTVLSDGRPYRVQLATFDSSARVQLVAMPEFAPGVLTKSVQENAGKSPILAGPVDLIRHSGLIGRTSVLFVAAGDRFELGWGPEPDLRIKRDTDVTEEKSRMLSSWVERNHEIEIRLSNLGQRKHTVKVTERVPVSEIDKVKITVDLAETTDGKRPDDNGFVEWDVTLGAGEHKRLLLCYKLERHEDVRGI